MKKISVRADQDYYEKVQLIADTYNMTVSGFVRMCIDRAIATDNADGKIDELSDQLATEFQHLNKQMSEIKQQTSVGMIHGVKQANNELSTQLNKAFGFELDQFRADMTKLVSGLMRQPARPEPDEEYPQPHRYPT